MQNHTKLQSTDSILRLPDVVKKVGLSKTSIYELLKESDSKFPQPIKLSSRCIGFSQNEIDQWIAERKEARA